MRNLFVLGLLALTLTGCVTEDDSGNQVNSHHSDQPTISEESPMPDDATTDHFYFSYDDSSSTAARDLSIFSLENGTTPATSWGRAYEFLNAEQFDHFAPESAGPFQVSFGSYMSQAGEFQIAPEEERVLALGINISGPTMTKQERPNVVLTLLVDISGSMSSQYASETRNDIQSLLDVTKHGLQQLPLSLKSGDVVNLVTFDTNANIVVEGWQADQADWNQIVSGLSTNGSTNLNVGIQLAYEVANRQYNAAKSNRVVILTDAYANRGTIDANTISEHTVINGLEGIHFAGIGIGNGFNEDFLNELTEAGKGVYSAMITPNDAERIFTNGFMRFIDSAVKDVKFKLEYPSSLKHVVSAAEETSENENEIQSIEFAYNSDQFFFELFSPQNDYSDQSDITLVIQYKGQDGKMKSERLTKSITDLLQQGDVQIKAAAAVSTLAFLISGNASCEDITASGLSQQQVESQVFNDYKQYINTFCSL